MLIFIHFIFRDNKIKYSKCQQATKKKSTKSNLQRPPWPPPQGKIHVWFIYQLLLFCNSSVDRNLPRARSSYLLPIISLPSKSAGKTLFFIIILHILIFLFLADTTITLLLRKETNLMVQRAIGSASKHGIKLKHGTPNPGTGDCAFEAVIQNNNDRSCYTENYVMKVDCYRRIWATDIEKQG